MRESRELILLDTTNSQLVYLDVHGDKDYSKIRYVMTDENNMIVSLLSDFNKEKVYYMDR